MMLPARLIVARIVRRPAVAARRHVSSAATERKTLTAHFPRTVSIYEGSDVRVLGVRGRHGRRGDARRATDVVVDDVLRAPTSRSPPTPRP